MENTKTHFAINLSYLSDGLSRAGSAARKAAISLDSISGKSLPRPLCRWWMRLRPICKGFQIESCGEFLPPIELYVPWWAWPFELVHRLIFGRAKLHNYE